MRSVAAVVIFCAVAAQSGAAQSRPKQLKDQAEHELYNRAVQDTADPRAQIQTLDAWSKRYPDSDYKDDRLYLYMQAYSRMSPPESGKVVQIGGQLMSRDLGGGMVALNVLFLVAWHVANLSAPSAEDLALGRKAGRDLLSHLARSKPENKTDEEWTAARVDIARRAGAALVAIALAPGNQSMAKNPPDCIAAETAYRQALAEYPDEAATAYNLGRALSCLSKYPQALYHFVRAAAIDPTIGGGADYATNLYVKYHGSDEGLAQLRESVKHAAHPPDGFTIETAADMETRKHREYALWMAIRRQLAAANGRQYFEGQLKNTLISLKGTVVEGRPRCRPKELLVSIPPATVPELVLRLDSAVPGEIVSGEIEFEAVPRILTAEPLQVVMDAARAKIHNLIIAPCANK